MIYKHISNGIDAKVKDFSPSIPEHRMKDEDNNTKRICVAPSIEKCLESYPYLIDLVTDGGILSLYEVNSKDVKHIKNENLLGLVPDTNETEEAWILEKFKSKRKVIRIISIDTFYDRVTGDYYGAVENLVYESEIEKFDRYISFVIKDDEIEEFLNLLKNSNYTDIEIVNYYSNNVVDKFLKLDENNRSNLKRNYLKKHISFTIPKGISAVPYWSYYIEKENGFKDFHFLRMNVNRKYETKKSL